MTNYENTDLANYDDMIAEAETMYEHLLEWYEQFTLIDPAKVSTQEAHRCKDSLQSIVSVIDSLRRARYSNELYNRTGEDVVSAR
jgi:molecular chaperone GrpE (heat shock protein)